MLPECCPMLPKFNRIVSGENQLMPPDCCRMHARSRKKRCWWESASASSILPNALNKNHGIGNGEGQLRLLECCQMHAERWESSVVEVTSCFQYVAEYVQKTKSLWGQLLNACGVQARIQEIWPGRAGARKSFKWISC